MASPPTPVTTGTPPPPATALPDQPPVPTARSSLFVKLYAAVAAAGVITYLAVGLLGWNAEAGTRDKVPPNVRSSPGGYRSYHFWHSGYHGGK